MKLPRKDGGYSAWWLVLGGILTALVGFIFIILDASGIYDVHRSSLTLAPITVGALLVIVGVVLGIRGKRVD